MRVIWVLLVAALLAAVFQGALAQGSYEPNIDRQGSDYQNFDIHGGPAACLSACANDRRCAAWTFVHPNVQGASQRCWLKSSVPPPRGDTCCVSGVMHSPAASTAGNGQNYNPAWQAAPGDSSCCPNNMLVCPVGRHFCTSPAANAAAGKSQSYNPAWQAAPGDTSCCPNNMLVCPIPRHFCPR
jgi:hypothetical protein